MAVNPKLVFSLREKMTKTILILTANPKNTMHLRLDLEVREIENGLQRAQKRDEFTIRQRWASRPIDIRRAMLDFKPSIVHFCGHGAGEEGLVVEDENGQAKFISTEALSGFFELFCDSVNCVVLNACYSEIQATAIAKHIPYVIGMNKAIGDKAAIEFAVAFYDAIGTGEKVEFAYKIACNAIEWAGIPEHLTPVLKMNANLVEKTNLYTHKLHQEKNDYGSLQHTIYDPPERLDIELLPGIEMSFVHIPSGKFLMGSNKERDGKAFKKERPQHSVELDEYWIGRFPVTNLQYSAFSQSSGRRFDIAESGHHKPVVNITWFDAIAFCEWASQSTGYVIRLPSEAEWEKAARGTDGRLYPWGDSPPNDKLANIKSFSTTLAEIGVGLVLPILTNSYGSAVLEFGDTTPVGQFSPQGDSPFGCSDLAGNVWEWTRSIYEKYPYSITNKREATYAEGNRVLRGGSYVNSDWVARCASRTDAPPNFKDKSYGFRVVIIPTIAKK